MFVISHGQKHRSWRVCFTWFQYVTAFGSNGTGVTDFGFSHSESMGPAVAMGVKTRFAAASATNYERLTTAPARKCFTSTWSCTEPTRTGSGGVYVERGGQTWSKQVNRAQTYRETKNEGPYARPIRYEEPGYFPLENQEKKASALRSHASLKRPPNRVSKQISTCYSYCSLLGYCCRCSVLLIV